MALQSINPATGKVVASYPETAPDEVKRIIVNRHAAHLAWRRTGFGIREFVNVKTVFIAGTVSV